VNLNFATAAVEGALTLAGDLIDFGVVQDSASRAGDDVLPASSEVRKAAQAVSKRRWKKFGYDFVLSACYSRSASGGTFLRLAFTLFRFLTPVIDLFSLLLQMRMRMLKIRSKQSNYPQC
jgi:hypothetical protein